MRKRDWLAVGLVAWVTGTMIQTAMWSWLPGGPPMWAHIVSGIVIGLIEGFIAFPVRRR